MSKKRAPARSSNVAFGFGAPSPFGAASAFSSPAASQLSYVTEPPDLSTISDGNLIVLFKNLSKKDNTTKSRALEELTVSVCADSDIDDAVLSAWIRLYPRLSIDTSPRVRNLSHSTHGTLSQRAGRKLVPHMSRIIGAWLSGQYDSDRATARAARSALTAVFPTAEKVAGVWKHYHGDILDYCSTVLTEENAETLSDERSVSVDDSQSKWSRVVAACVLTVAQLISNLPTNELSKQEASYTTLFASSRLWEFAYHPEPGPRKATYTLLRATLKSRPDLILANLPAVSTSLLVKALETPQIGSVAELLNTMVTLTTVFPDCWGVAKARKGKGAVEKLTRFIAGGSQGGGAAYWSGVQALVEVLPGAKIALTKAVVDGIHKGEQRLNLPAAWGCYLAVCFRVLEDDKDGIVLDSAVWPVYEEFLLRKDPMGRMAVPGVGAAVCAAGVAMAGVRGERVVKLVGEQVWGRGVALVKEGIPEGAADEIGARWVEMGAEVLRRTKDGNPVIDLVRRSHADVAVTCIAAIPADRGQWPEVSVLLESILSRFGEAVCNAEEVAVVTVPFFTKIIPTLLDTPSLTPLLGALIAYGTYTTNTPVFQTSWTKIVPSLLHLPAPVATKAITQLLTSTTSSALRNRIPHVEELSSYISTHLQTALTTDDAASWALITASFHSSAVPAVVTTHLLDTLTAALGTSEEKLVSKICLHLHTLSLQNASVLSTFARSTHGADLLSRLLVPMESLDSKVAAAARVVSAVLESGIQGEGQAERIVGELADIIARGVRVPAEIELTLRVMAGKAQDMAMRTPQAERGALVERLVFTTEIWEGALQPFLRGLRRVSLGITGPMGGCVFLVPNETGEVDGEVEVEVEVVRDGMGVSSALRMGMFIVEFLKGTVDIFTTISEEARVVLLFYVSLTLELAKDNLSILGANDLWTGNSSEFEAEVLEFISDAQIFIAACIKECKLAYLFVDRLLDASLAQTTTGFYAARVLTVAMSDLTENARISAEQVQAWIKGVNVRKGTDVFRTTAILTGLVEHLEASKDADRLRNELASDLTGVPPTKAAEEGLRKMIYLNAVLPRPGDDGVAPPLSSQRVIFLVKHLLGWFEDEEFSAEPNMPVIAEAAKLFTGVLQAVKELYGEHWQALCDFVVDCWHMCAEQGMREEDIPVAFSTLKLFATLRSLQDENDDIQDAWNNSTSAFYVALVSLLRNSREPDELHQPRNMCNELMARQIKSLDLKPLEGPGDIYPLLNVRSRPIQEAAWDILHRYIPSVQEQVSIEAAFSREETFQLQLPAELLSLILEPPTMKKVEGLSFERSMPLALRGYLLTWILIFDHFENASFKVKSAYIENLKEGSYITGLFDFTFDFLGHAKGRPIDASKFQIESYSPNSEESPEKDTQWLLIHLYYLSLRFTPSLAKGWWIDCKSRQKVLSVEKFTEKYLSPIIIDKELQSVRTWIQERPAPTPGEEDQEMQVKISRGAAKEVTAVYPIDDQTMEMVVRLPPTFPLRQVEVEGVKRVGLTESQFKKMQLASQAVINFQSASIIDGLTLFHKNVQLHFDGVAECAICYSILAVTPDRALPNKACQTCKHKFHSTCLLKWFKSSNSSSCPLCRTSFTFYT